MADEPQDNGSETQTEQKSLLEEIIFGGRIAPEETDLAGADLDEEELAELTRQRREARAKARNIVNEFVDKVATEDAAQQAKKKSIQQLIQAVIAELDERIFAQLNEILHDKKFQELEASWRGLKYLVSKAETGERLKLRVMNISKGELLKDLEKAIEFDQSALFKKVYEEEYGTLGGKPYSMLMGDYSFSRHPKDIEQLNLISQVAAAAHAPFIAAADPNLFDLQSFKDLPVPRDLAKVFESTELAPWRAFRESEDSRYVALTLPRVMMRLPYGAKTQPVEGLDFEENVYIADPEYDRQAQELADRGEPVEGLGRRADHDRYLWGNPAYVLSERIANAFSLHGWTAAIRGVEGGGKIEGLPWHTFTTLEGDIAYTCPTEVSITDRRERELNEMGFISAVHCKGETYAAFFGGQTTNKPKLYNTSQANANARLSAMLPYMLNASRFAHYTKVMMRDKIGSFMTEDNVRDYLNLWISDYVLGKDDAGQSIKAKYPLREARVDVKPIPGRPGAYNAVLFVRPHFQLEELTASIRLVAELPPAA